MVQWLRFRPPDAGGTGSIPGWGTRIPHPATRTSQQKRKRERKKERKERKESRLDILSKISDAFYEAKVRCCWGGDRIGHGVSGHQQTCTDHVKLTMPFSLCQPFPLQIYLIKEFHSIPWNFYENCTFFLSLCIRVC